MTLYDKSVTLRRSVFFLLVIFLIVIGYFLGGLTVYKQLFPYDQIRYVKNILIGGSLQNPATPKPRNTIFETFYPKADVVMIGDSITNGAEWRDMFPSVNIVNRGIGGDRADDILRRMDPIFAVQPKRAFVMVGINDIYYGHSVDVIFKNYVEIVRQLKAKNIEVYIQSTIECSKDKCGSNLDKVRSLNGLLKDYAENNGIRYIDINDGLVSVNDGLLAAYTYDGIHLLGSGYKLWAEKLKPFVGSGE